MEVIRELKINSVLEHTDQYRDNWKHVQRMDRSRVPRQMMTYRPKGKRSLGRPHKRWRETVTGHWGLIRVRKKKNNLEKPNTLVSTAWTRQIISKSDTGLLGTHVSWPGSQGSYFVPKANYDFHHFLQKFLKSGSRTPFYIFIIHTHLSFCAVQPVQFKIF
jgi:hypothetical protein